MRGGLARGPTSGLRKPRDLSLAERAARLAASARLCMGVLPLTHALLNPSYFWRLVLPLIHAQSRREIRQQFSWRRLGRAPLIAPPSSRQGITPFVWTKPQAPPCACKLMTSPISHSANTSNGRQQTSQSVVKRWVGTLVSITSSKLWPQ